MFIHKYLRFWVLCGLLFLMGYAPVAAQTPLSYITPAERTVLTGPDCLINQFATVVGVVRVYDNLSALTDEDLQNHATVVTTANVGLGVGPVLSIKDTKRDYAAGTKAGFCLVSGSDGGLLSLDVIKLFSITTYLDGVRGKTYPVTSGTETGGVQLELIKVPGSNAVSLDITITPTENFDELYLEINEGISLSTFNTLKIKYAFVGEAKEYKLTYNGMRELGRTILIDKCHSMPWPVKPGLLHRTDNLQDIILNHNQASENFSDKLFTGGLAIGEWGHVQIGVDNAFEAGTEVGFLYSSAGLLNVNLGGFTTITLYNKGKKVQEEVMDVGVLGLGVVSVSGLSKTSVVAEVPFDAARLTVGAGVLSVDLGEALGIYYGYVKKKPKTCHHCPLFVNMDPTLCSNETAYQLKSNVPVRWELIEATPYDPTQQIDNNLIQIVPDITGNLVYQVSGLQADGIYTFKATALNCPHTPPCSEIVTLRKGIQASPQAELCGRPIQNPADGAPVYTLSTSAYGVTGSLISISNLKNETAILDGKLDNYATYVSGLSLASNMGIIGLRTINQTPIEEGVTGDKRVGFIVENASTFLDADALQFLQIRLFRKGVWIKDARLSRVIDESTTVGAGLIGSQKSQKMRFSIKVPGDIEFDEFQLWTSGVLNLGLNTLRIYYGFIESADANCSDPLRNDCASIVSTDRLHASLDIQIPAQTVSAATVLAHADYLLDNDMNTALIYEQTANVGAGLVLNIKLGRTLDDSQQLGIVLDSKNYLAGVNAASWLTVETYYQGVATGEKFTNWRTLGLDVIGYGDKSYLISRPSRPYDEVRLVIAGVASALEVYKLYGLFLRSDIDGDGIPDCQDPESCSSGLSHLEATPHLCVGESVVLTGQADFKEPSQTFQVEITTNFNDQTVPKAYIGTITMKRGVFQQVITTLQQAGQYYMLLKKTPVVADTQPIAILSFTVHPLETTWHKNVSSTDWNKWTNWNNGSPWTCTNVIIPSQAMSYPILLEDVMNGCNYIHFEPEAEVVHTHRLTYQKAWVEVALLPNRYYMLSAPLKKIYSGDWFIAANQTNMPYFTFLDEQTWSENRVTPTIYQRVWDATTVDKLIDAQNRPYPQPSERVDLMKTGWTKPFNWLATPYDKNQVEGVEYDFNALSVWVHPSKPIDPSYMGTGSKYIFRFPKNHTVYHYYNEEGEQLSVAEQIHDRTQSGRFIYEQADSSVVFPLVMTFKNRSSASNTTFLVGNPFMAHINVQAFLKANSHITSVKVYDGANGTSNSVIAQLDGEGVLTATSTNQIAYTSIAPMQSFFVTCVGSYAESCAVTFTEEMLESKPGTDATLRMAADKSDEKHSLYLKAEAEGKSAKALVHFSPRATDHYREKEDAVVLIENEEKPTVALYTIADQQALDIQQRAHGGKIPLGIYLSRPAEVTLYVTPPDDEGEWLLNDQLTGGSYALSVGKTNRIPLGYLTSNVGRFTLSGHAGVVGCEPIVATQPELCCFREEGTHQLVISTDAGMMVRCEVYSAMGRQVGLSTLETNVYRLPVPDGLHIVKVFFADGVTASAKVF